MNLLKKGVERLGVSRLLIVMLLIVLVVSVGPLRLNPGMMYSDCIVRVGMNGTFVLAAMVSIYCGTGLNFGLPIGIICGLLGGAIANQLDWSGLPGFLGACVVSVPFAITAGWGYAKLLNNVKGSEMTVGNYVSFSTVSFMSLMWLLLPFTNRKMLIPLTGIGLRPTLTLEDSYASILDNLLRVDFARLGLFQDNDFIRSFTLPTGLLLVFGLLALLVWLFTRTKYGVLMRCNGSNPRFMALLGVNNDRMRMTGIILSTVLAAVGINIYSQSYGFYQFYSAPLMMAFPALAAVLIGGATPRKATVTNAVLGVVLFQSLLTLATPVASTLLNAGTISEEIRKVVQNSIIIYALTKAKETP